MAMTADTSPTITRIVGISHSGPDRSVAAATRGKVCTGCVTGGEVGGVVAGEAVVGTTGALVVLVVEPTGGLVVVVVSGTVDDVVVVTHEWPPSMEAITGPTTLVP